MLGRKMETSLPVLEPSSIPARAESSSPSLRERFPARVWGKQKTLWLKYPQKLAVDYFIKTRSYKDVVSALREEGFFVNMATVSRWLHKEDVREYLKEQIEERGIASSWSKDRWLAMMTKHLSGEQRLAPGDLYAMKLISGVCGFEEPQQVNVQSINFVQATGKP